MIDVVIISAMYGVASWCTFTFISGVPIYQKIAIKYPKPFGCALCFSFWLSLISLISGYGSFDVRVVTMATLAALTAEIIERKIVV